MEISKKEFKHFIASWLSTKNVSIDIKQIFELLDLIDECYEDKMMFDSWFRGIDVMN